MLRLGAEGDPYELADPRHIYNNPQHCPIQHRCKESVRMSPHLDSSRVPTALGLVPLAILFCWIANPSARASNGVTPTTITKIGIYSGTTGSPGAYVYFSPALPGLEGCTNSVGNEVWIDFTSTSEPTGKSLYATTIAGWLAGHTVSFEVSRCAFGLPLVYNVEVGP